MPILSKSRVATSFDSYAKTIFTHKEVAAIINSHLATWTLPRRRKAKNEDEFHVKTTGQRIVFERLKNETKLLEIDLPFPYRKIKRFTWGTTETHEVIQTVNTKGYFSHYSAIEIHALSEQIPKTIYFNIEQPATGGGGTLSQAGINRAFANKCRVSNNRIEYGDTKICLLNGQNTNCLGVEETQFNNSTIRVTNVDRTLIDATVRTIYAGGIGEVANVYKNAATTLSVERITNYLRDLNYTYPFHQAIGYYLERTGNFTDDDLLPLRRNPIEFDFYITYQLRNPEYNEKWRLFVPKGF